MDLDTVDHPDCRSVLAKFTAARVAVGIWETTRDIRISTFQCAIVDCTEEPGRSVCVSGGAGCHPARHIALLRALTEAAQSRLTGITGSCDDCFRDDYREIRDPLSVAAHRRSIEVKGRRSFRSAPTLEAATFESDVAWELDRLTEAGVNQVIVVDLIKPEIDIPVVRVIIPDLEAILNPSECEPGPRARRVLEARH